MLRRAASQFRWSQVVSDAMKLGYPLPGLGKEDASRALRSPGDWTGSGHPVAAGPRMCRHGRPGDGSSALNRGREEKCVIASRDPNSDPNSANAVVHHVSPDMNDVTGLSSLGLVVAGMVGAG